MGARLGIYLGGLTTEPAAFAGGSMVLRFAAATAGFLAATGFLAQARRSARDELQALLDAPDPRIMSRGQAADR
jgi:hypothetical protein